MRTFGRRTDETTPTTSPASSPYAGGYQENVAELHRRATVSGVENTLSQLRGRVLEQLP